MIQRRTWKDITGSEPAQPTTALPDGEGVIVIDVAMVIGTMAFQGMSYQFAGLHPDDAAEQAARWLQQNTGQDEIEPIVLVAGEHSFVLTKVGTAVVVSESATKPKVYR